MRELDTAQSRVQATLDRIRLVMDRMHAIEGIQAALQREDYEAAAECVARCLELDDEAGAGEGDAAVAAAVPEADRRQAQEQARVLAEGRAALEGIVRQRGAAAAAAQDHAGVVRFACVHGPLRLRQEGLELLTSYLRGLIASRAREDFAALVDGFAAGEGARPDYLGTLTNLFRDVAAAVDEHFDVLREAFGPELGVTGLLTIHTEVDIHGTRLLQRYADYRRLARIAGQVGMRRRDDTTAESAPVEPRQVEAFLEELLLLCQRSEEYTQYLLARLGEVAGPGGLPSARETALRGSAFSTAVRELLSYYLSLEEYYMEESVAKAIRIDEASPGALTSSMVDDTFFVLLKAGRRCLGTGKVPSVVAILNTLNSLLSGLYRNALAAKLQGAAGRLVAAGGPGAAEEGGGAAAAAAVPFNNADVSAGYVAKLRQQLEGLAGAVFPAAHDHDRVALVLADLGKTAADLRGAAMRAMDQLCGGLMPRLRPALDEAAALSYHVSEGELATDGSGPAGGGASAWPQALLLAFSAHLGWLQPLLTPANWESLVHLTLDKVVARLEAVLTQKRYTQLGALQLEKDLRLLVGSLSELTASAVRDKFARLVQIASVLTVESVREMAEYWGEGGFTRLTPDDVRTVLGQRVDFTAEQVFALDL